MTVTVEFFGIPRLRAGCAKIELDFPEEAESVSLREIFSALETHLPEFAQACLCETGLQPGYIANLGARQFITDPTTKIPQGESLLILSADVGG